MKSTQVSYLTSKHISIARGLVLQKFAIRTVMACLISFQVITRMNILVAVLCLIMGRPYQFYYFVPLVTFWFVVVYAVMALWPRVTAARVKGEYNFFWSGSPCNDSPFLFKLASTLSLACRAGIFLVEILLTSLIPTAAEGWRKK